MQVTQGFALYCVAVCIFKEHTWVVHALRTPGCDDVVHPHAVNGGYALHQGKLRYYELFRAQWETALLTQPALYAHLHHVNVTVMGLSC